MNRILPHLYRKSPFLPAPEAPSICGYCKQALEHSKFSAFSADNPRVAICSDCIQRMDQMSRLSKLNQLEPDWVAICGGIGKRLLCEPGTKAAKRAVATLLRKLAQRSASILNGEREMGLKRCGMSGLPLMAPRIALLGRTTDCLFHLIQAAAETIGMQAIEGAGDGAATIKQLLEKIGHDQRFLDHSIVFSADFRYLSRTDRCPIIVASPYRPDALVDLVIDVPHSDIP